MRAWARYLAETVALLALGLCIGHATGSAYDVIFGRPVDTDFDAGFWAALMVTRAWRR